MMLPAPNLDDRRFQDLVDDAKRLVALRCPEWTDHNVSDPGVTLIETFAFMTDELFYRLNRVPDRLHVAFLDLIGFERIPAAPASVELLFWLSAPQPVAVSVPEGTEAGTPRREDTRSTVFTTTRSLEVPPRTMTAVTTQATGADPTDRGELLRGRASVPAFGAHPAAGDAMYFGLSGAVGRCAVALRFDCTVSGVGVDPTDPPLVWEAWSGSEWITCELLGDETGGLNVSGDVVLLVPEAHVESVISGTKAGWLRCRVVEPLPGLPTYTEPPVVHAVSAFTIGGTAPAVHGNPIDDEVLGLSEGVPGQRFELTGGSIVSGEPIVVEVAAGPDWDEWTEVTSFADSGPEDRVIHVDRASGVVTFPPAVRERDGGLTVYGAVPPKGAPMRVRRYRSGGGPDGNVAAGAISVLRATIPFVLRVENRRAARGGVAAESMEEARVRAPVTLRSRDRAVTVEDYEQLARAASPSVARARALPASAAAEAGGVRVLIVPTADQDADGHRRFEDLAPDAPTLAAVAEQLEARRTIGTRVLVEPPLYRGVTVVARLSSTRRSDPEAVRAEATRALYRYLDPLVGGQDGTGWAFGRPVFAGEVFSALQAVRGVELVDDVLLFAADPITGKRGDPVQRVDVDANALVFSFEHRVRVTAI